MMVQSNLYFRCCIVVTAAKMTNQTGKLQTATANPSSRSPSTRALRVSLRHNACPAQPVFG